MKNPVDILKSFDIDYIVAPHSSGVIILFLFPYAPFEPFPAGHMFVDNYYLASHKGYHRTNEVIAALKVAGLKAARYRGEPLKNLAERIGAGKRCKNDLIYTKKYGSYIYLDAVIIEEAEMNLEPRQEKEKEKTECALCIAACPNNALSEKGFERGRCLRQFMDKRHSPTEEEQKLIGDRLMGCIDCRAVCPRNAKILPVSVPPEILAATKKGKIDYNKIKEYIGDKLFKN